MNPRGLEPVPGAKRPDRVESNVDWTSGLMLGLVVVVALLSFLWPLLVVPSAALDGNALSPFIFAVLLPIVIGIVVSQLSRGTIDPKTLAMLGVLSALGALSRPLGAGTAGIEFVFIPLILGGRVFGPPSASCSAARRC